MHVGIENLNLYAGRLAVDALALAEEYGRDRDKMRAQAMIDTRTVTPYWEDAVTLAVNAAKPLLNPQLIDDIELLIVATESAVDHAKPVATWVHRYCGLAPTCRTLECKHACYGGTGALKLAAAWVASAARPGKKALIVSADYTRTRERSHIDAVGGGSSVAMIVGADPQVLGVDLGRAGFFTTEIADAFRPTARDEIIDSELSLYSYLDALDGALDSFADLVGPVAMDAYRRHIYHAPFPGMTLYAHRALLNRAGVYDEDEVDRSFTAKVAPGLTIARRIGTAYGASTFVSLLSLLASADEPLKDGDLISIFAYGSGCQGEFYEGVVGPGARQIISAHDPTAQLDERVGLSVSDFQDIEDNRQKYTDEANYAFARDTLPDSYRTGYADRGLLVLDGVRDYRRSYRWS